MRNPMRKFALLFLVGMLVLGLVALVWALGSASSQAQDSTMHNCPQPGKWAIAVWDGDDGTDAEQAFATCGQGAVAAAYSIDSQTQAWSGWFAGQAKLSTLTALDNTEGVVALGGTGAVAGPASSPTPPATPAPSVAGGTMHNCPQPGKWAIAVWDGDDGTDAEQAFATCGQGAVAAAYSIDSQTQVWSGWFAGQAKLSSLTFVNNTQGVVALGGTGAAAAPTPSSTLSPTPPATGTPSATPSPTVSPTPAPTTTPITTAVGGPPTDFLQTFHATLDMSAELDGLEMDVGSEGDFEAPDSCSCDISATMPPLPSIEQRLIVIGDKAWIDTGDGWQETTPSDPQVAELVMLCPACPAFWEGYYFEGPLPPGEQETKNGVPSIHYTLTDLYEAFAAMGLMPEELEGLSIDTLDVWLAEDGYWPVSVDMDVCADAEAIAMFTTVPGGVESACMALAIDITQVNDPTIQVNPPQ